MSDYHQLLVFTDGNAYDPSTWSNVPYMFVTAFSSQFPDISVHTCDIRVNNFIIRAISKLYNKIFTPLLGKLCTFNRTNFYSYLVYKKMQKAVDALSSDSAILLSFDFSHLLPKRERKEDCTALLCDWTIEYEIREHQKRVPTRMEEKLIRRQNKIISEADYVTSIFPFAAKYITEKCHKPCFYSGKHKNVDKHIKIHANSNRIESNRFLFIGNKAYLPGLKIIVDAIENYNKYNPSRHIWLDVIGMTDEVGDFSRHIVFHGYLNKKILTKQMNTTH